MTDPVRNELTARGRGLNQVAREVAGGKAGGEDDARGPLAGDPGDRREVAHECDQRDRPEEGTDVERGGHARMAEAEAGSDDDAEDRSGEGAVGDGFREEDAPIKVCERADEATERSDERDVQGGDYEEAQDHDASPAPSRAEDRVHAPFHARLPRYHRLDLPFHVLFHARWRVP